VSVCLVDTSILCEILQVPNKHGSHAEIFEQMERKIRERESLLLPMSAILETGNHIGQNGDGNQRRSAAGRFVSFVGQAIRGEIPFTPTPLFETEPLLEWLGEFPDWANRGSGLADLTIQKEFARQCALHRARRIYIWSLDGHLSSYHREP
jgi:hypothetical protein